ncbi:M48 family metallopeptidase [Uliginosibacterium sp. H1]|uniref:M48 family metallopeptidase n=1 Tax=Uliginosibacterium sp. H1 TaxID=3114757 RepID=UPI002E17A791|nr:M48 family metalloprotease [Uliginosibacterium sp. H1]
MRNPLIMALVVLTLGACATPATLMTAGTTSTPAEASAATEAELAKERAEDVNRQQVTGAGLARIEPVSAHLNALLDRIRSAGPQPAHPAQVFIRNDPGYIAFTSPSGNIYVSLGWLASVGSEDELVALLAHEYGHAASSHLSRNWIGASGYFGLLGTAVGAISRNKQMPLSVPLAVSVWGAVVSPSWSRSQELEADAIALDVSTSLGYSYTQGPKAFLERIARLSISLAQSDKATAGNNLFAFSESHPDPADRLSALDTRYREKAQRNRSQRGDDPWLALMGRADVKALFQAYQQAADIPKMLVDKQGQTKAMQRVTALRQGPARDHPFILTNAATVYWAANRTPEMLAALNQATTATDSQWTPYFMLGRHWLGQRRFDDATTVMEAGYQRFGKPAALYPAMIEHYRIVRDASAKNSSQQLNANLQLLALQSQCILQPDFSEECTQASMTDAQRAQAKRQEEALKRQNDQKLQAQIEKLIKDGFK